MRDQRLAGNGGRWGDKFLRADRKWQSWQMRDYSGDARVFPIVTEEKRCISRSTAMPTAFSRSASGPATAWR